MSEIADSVNNVSVCEKCVNKYSFFNTHSVSFEFSAANSTTIISSLVACLDTVANGEQSLYY